MNPRVTLNSLGTMLVITISPLVLVCSIVILFLWLVLYRLNFELLGFYHVHSVVEEYVALLAVGFWYFLWTWFLYYLVTNYGSTFFLLLFVWSVFWVVWVLWSRCVRAGYGR